MSSYPPIFRNPSMRIDVQYGMSGLVCFIWLFLLVDVCTLLRMYVVAEVGFVDTIYIIITTYE